MYDFTKKEELKDELIKKGNLLLSFVEKTTLGYNTMVDILDEKHIKELEEWYCDVEEFVERYGLECHKEDLDNNSWIINQGRRVSVERIKKIISILNRISN